MILALIQANAPADIAFRIEAMVMRDQEVRNRWVDGMQKGKVDPAIAVEVARIDNNDSAAMKLIVSQNGWPTISKFGRECSSNAWLLIQHADRDRPFQRKCLALMKPLLAKREVSSQNYAYLYDRVSVADTGKQLYGTQGIVKDGKMVLQPVIDPRRLDQRRKDVGLMPAAEYLKLLRDMYLPKEKKK